MLMDGQTDASTITVSWADPESPLLTLFFFINEGRGDPNGTKSWPLSAHQRNAI